MLFTPNTGDHSKLDQILLVKIEHILFFCVYRRSYLVFNSVPRHTTATINTAALVSVTMVVVCGVVVYESSYLFRRLLFPSGAEGEGAV